LQTATLVPRMTFLQLVARFILKLIGWRLEGGFPNLSKYILIGAPHTTNWDFPLGLLLMWATGRRYHFLGKDSLFRPPHGWIFRGLGGIPVYRHRRSNFVSQIVEVLNNASDLIIVISPEGTRKKSPYWKTGFYYMALGAKIPIVTAYLDYEHKAVGFGPLIHPTGDIQADFAIIRAFYGNIRGKYPEKQGPIEIKPPEEA
jgi:1-acyl-sn-glycerol-3-phosphate acyltransferase